MFLQAEKLHHHAQLYVPGRKENCVKKFEIAINKSPGHRFQPGDEVSGAVELEIRRPLEICFMEFTVCGYAIACAIHPQQGLSSSKRETYIKKKILVLGSADGVTTTIIVPGRYSSKFSFKLPPSLPSTCIYEDQNGSLSFQIRYFVQARLCDDIVTGTVHGFKRKTVIKVFMDRHQDLIVYRPFDIAAVPMAMWPVSHGEDIVLGCGPFDSEVSSLTATLDRSMYSAGDVITIKIETDVLHVKHYKTLRCDLSQRIKLKRTPEVLCFIIATSTIREPKWKIERLESTRPVAYLKVTLQTWRNMLPSVLDGCNLLNVTYAVRVSVRMVNQAARTVFEVPLSLAPSNNALTGVHDTERKVPIFKRPIRFPRFTDSAKTRSANDSGGESTELSNRSSDNSEINNTSTNSQKVTVCVHV